MSKTFAKQIFYGILYLTILALLAWGFYLIALKSPPTCSDGVQNGNETGVDCGGLCVACEIKKLKPLSLSPATLFGFDRVYSVGAELRNPNMSFGAEDFSYEVNFYDEAGKILKTIKNKSFVYAGETKDIIEVGIKITEGIPVKGEIKIDAPGIIWEKTQDFFQPKITLNKVNFINEKTQVSLSGSLKNSNNFVVSRIILSAFLVDKLGVKVGVSKTELKNLDPFIVENFKISFLVDKTLAGVVDSKATAASLSVEVLK